MGQYHHRCHTVEMVSRSYPLLREEREADGRWLSVAYIEGFVNGLTFLISEDADRELMPIYYVQGSEPLRTRDDYERVAPSFDQLSPDAFAYARHQAERLAPRVVFQHLPVLL